MELINADVAFLVMLGAAIWTSIQLAQRSLRACTQRAVGVLCRATAVEGLVCALAWLITSVIAARGFSVIVAMQSVVVGLIWAGFSFVARLSFQGRSPATR